jgi:hypothetical protein
VVVFVERHEGAQFGRLSRERVHLPEFGRCSSFHTLFLSALLSYKAPSVTLGSAAGEVGIIVLQIDCRLKSMCMRP